MKIFGCTFVQMSEMDWCDKASVQSEMGWFDKASVLQSLLTNRISSLPLQFHKSFNSCTH